MKSLSFNCELPSLHERQRNRKHRLFCMSQFLTMMVFLTLVSQSMPSSSLTMSYFALLVGSQILISGISILFVATSIYIQCQSKNKARQSKVLTKLLAPSLCFRFLCRSCNEGSSQLKLRDFIKWEYLDQEINCRKPS
jgi:hypothetical protein